jgi:4-amino-4-deoxy-L-arabinose transferase-like glycosyltransferase
MEKNNRFLSFKTFVFFSGALCLLYCILFRPVTYEAQGDFPSYLELAKQIFNMPGAGSESLSHRSPLYSIVLGIFIKISGETHFHVTLMVFQYVLIFFSSLLIWRIFNELTENIAVAFIAGAAGLLNLTTVYYGYMLVTETMALFLFSLMVFLLLQYLSRGGLWLAFLAGITAALLVLTRFNAIGIPLVIIVVMAVYHIINHGLTRISLFIGGAAIFSVAVLIPLGLWSFHNYRTGGAFELLPREHAGQRWAVPATINEKNRVGPEQEEVLRIFLKARAELLSAEEATDRKGSLLPGKLITRVSDYFMPRVSGFLLYRYAEPELLKYYNLNNDTEGIRALAEKLEPFYKAIAEQNRSELSRLRWFSFLNTFKHISPTLPGASQKNLNKLPSPVIKAYKLLFIIMILSVYAGSLAHMASLLFRRDKFKSSANMIVLYGLIWYFPAVNWYANVLGDANRFRYPADMVIIGIFVTFCFFIFKAIQVYDTLNGGAEGENR